MERKNLAASDSVAALKTERDDLHVPMQRYQSMGGVSTLAADWTTSQPVSQPSQSPRPCKRIAVSPNPARPPVPAWSADVSAKTAQPPRGSVGRQVAAVPINLSLSEDEKSPNRSSAELQSPQLGKFPSAAAGQNAANSPVEDPDPLYEYFPFTVDDWMPPVDAVYRPHVVHHYHCAAQDQGPAGPEQGQTVFCGRVTVSRCSGRRCCHCDCLARSLCHGP